LVELGYSISEGPFYEDLVEGQVLKHSQGRTITDTDNIWFTLLTCNANQIHFNRDYAEKNFSNPPFNGKLVVNSLLVLSIVVGLSVVDVSRTGIMLGITDWKITNPTFAGDTLYAESQILEKRESGSHPNMGIVTLRTKGFKQGGVQVMEFKRTVMIRKRGKPWQ
jgi:itaconyl-CoA hydratase